MGTFAETVKATLEALRVFGESTTWTVALALLAASTISMAVVQIIKEVTPARRTYQRWWIDRWLQERERQIRATTGLPDILDQGVRRGATVADDLIELSVGGEARAFADLPPEELIVQSNAAAVIALDEANAYRWLVAVLACGSSITDLQCVFAGQPTDGSASYYFDCRNRVARRIQRNLDGLGIAMSWDWKFWVQLVALFLTVVVVEIAVAMNEPANSSPLVAILIAIVGGYLAPITHDLVAALQRLRGGA